MPLVHRDESRYGKRYVIREEGTEAFIFILAIWRGLRTLDALSMILMNLSSLQKRLFKLADRFSPNDVEI